MPVRASRLVEAGAGGDSVDEGGVVGGGGKVGGLSRGGEGLVKLAGFGVGGGEPRAGHGESSSQTKLARSAGV
ncbi:MAG TPA: hypothetical protein VMZ31_08720 [Phycisphaerae bacterium]|nr:hypothetical protein [Phycisphaerae bacterium]